LDDHVRPLIESKAKQMAGSCQEEEFERLGFTPDVNHPMWEKYKKESKTLDE
jgi:hypothetical protein